MNVIFSSSSGPVETSMGKAGVKQLHSALAEVLTDTIPPLGGVEGGRRKHVFRGCVPLDYNRDSGHLSFPTSFLLLFS